MSKFKVGDLVVMVDASGYHNEVICNGTLGVITVDDGDAYPMIRWHGRDEDECANERRIALADARHATDADAPTTLDSRMSADNERVTVFLPGQGYLIDCPPHLLPDAIREAKRVLRERAERAKADADAVGGA